VAPGRMRCQMSMVKMVDEELNTDVSEDIRAAIIAANIRPFKPGICMVTCGSLLAKCN